MSYCVNCGVELAPSEAKCPLCNTPVLNPADPWREPGERPYPPRVERVMSRIDRRYGAALASLFLLIPALVTLLSNLIADQRVTWSAYVLGALLCLFVWAILPFFCKKRHLVRFILLDLGAALLYLWLIDRSVAGADWFLPLGMPVALTAAAFLMAVVLLARYGAVRGLNIPAAAFFAIGLFTVALEALLNRYLGLGTMPRWSWFVLGPCGVIGLALMLLERRNKLKEEIKRRLFL